MKSTRSRMAVVAVVVCGFAVGMAGLLDYFKYRRTAEQLMEQRLHYIGNSIEANIVASLAVGLQFSEIGTLPATLERARALDDLIVGIDILDTEGQILYSTDRPRTGTHASEQWLKAAQTANGADWVMHSGADRAVGNVLQNSFGLVIGQVALRYSGERVQAAALQVAGDLALNAVAVFAVASLLATVMLGWVMRKLESDIGSVEAAIRAGDAQLASPNVRRGPFGAALERFLGTVRHAEAQIVDMRGRLQRGVRP